ncbi:uncharacterized protein ACH125_002866 [Urocitellus parryii]
MVGIRPRSPSACPAPRGGPQPGGPGPAKRLRPFPTSPLQPLPPSPSSSPQVHPQRSPRPRGKACRRLF